MTHMDFYLAHAHTARRNTMYASIASGALLGAAVDWLWGNFWFAFVASAVVTGTVELLRAVWYVEPDWKEQRAIAAFPVRRHLIFSSLSAIVLLVISRLRVPQTVAMASERKLLTASEDPTNSRSIDEAKIVLARAKVAQVRISPKALEAAGEKFIRVSAQNPAAWGAAMAMVEYRSYLNGPSVRREDFYPFGMPLGEGEPTYYIFNGPAAETLPRFTTSFKRVPIAMSARMELIGSPMTQSAHIGPELLLGVGGKLDLDGYYLRGIVLEGVTLYYQGGAVVLDNVTFVNCQFVIENVDKGRALGSQLLMASNVTFHNPAA